MGLDLEVPFAVMQRALAAFTGVQRRFQVKGEAAGVLVVDDYGHHPAEIRATLAAARQGFARRRVVVFQPHRYTRTFHLFDEFLTAFDDADVLIVTDIYPAGEPPIPGVHARSLAEGIGRAAAAMSDTWATGPRWWRRSSDPFGPVTWS